jgi:hypothetical protein
MTHFIYFSLDTSKMKLNLNFQIIFYIYSYMDWGTLQYYENVPDLIWKKIWDRFCLNFTKSNHSKNYRDMFLNFINDNIIYLMNHKFKGLSIPPILWSDRSFILMTIRRRVYYYNTQMTNSLPIGML